MNTMKHPLSDEVDEQLGIGPWEKHFKAIDDDYEMRRKNLGADSEVACRNRASGRTLRAIKAALLRAASGKTTTLLLESGWRIRHVRVEILDASTSLKIDPNLIELSVIPENTVVDASALPQENE